MLTISSKKLLREGGLEFGIPNKLHLFVGNQTFEWGSADGFNPTDVLNAQDYRRFTLYSTKRRAAKRCSLCESHGRSF